MKKPPALRNNNGVVQVRVRMDGKDHFINRIGRWDDPVAHAKASAIAAQIWADHQQGILDASLLSYQPAVKGKEVGLLAALSKKAEQSRADNPASSTPTACCLPTADPSNAAAM
jgi:integrase